MSEAGMTLEQTAEPSGTSALSALIQVFYAPGKVFDRIRAKPMWVLGLVACIIVVALGYYWVSTQIGIENIARHQMENSRFAAQMSADQKEQAIAQAATPARQAMTFAFIAVAFSIVELFYGLCGLLVANVSGGKIKFSQALGTAVYSTWPFVVITVILQTVVVAMSSDKAELDAQNLLAFNAAAFLDKATTARPLYALASSLDLLIFAQILLSAYGLSRVARISFSKSLTGVIGVWVVLALIRVGFSFVF